MSKRARYIDADEQTLASLTAASAQNGDEAEEEDATASKMQVTLDANEFKLQTTFAEPMSSITYNALDSSLRMNCCDENGAGFVLCELNIKDVLDRIGIQIKMSDVKKTVSAIKVSRQLSSATNSTGSVHSPTEGVSVIENKSQTAKGVKDCVHAQIDEALRHCSNRFELVGEDKDVVCITASRRRDRDDIIEFLSYPAEDKRDRKKVCINESDIVTRLLKMAEARDGEIFVQVIASAAVTGEYTIESFEAKDTSWNLSVSKLKDGFYSADILVETPVAGSDGYEFAPGLRLIFDTN